MNLNNEIILFEYFTAQSCHGEDYNKKIFKEAQKLSDSVILLFLRNKKLKKIHVIRNHKLRKIKDKRIFYHKPNKNLTFNKILNKVKTKKLILIAPESHKINLKIASKLKKSFDLLNSDYETLKIFSSKKKTFNILKKKKILVVKNEKEICNNSNKLFVNKPEYGAGSENIHLINEDSKKKESIIEEYYPGVKGSFSMLCKKKKMVLLSCSKQIIEIRNRKISQKGIIIGGTEEYREQIINLANKIVKNFPALFGFVGVDFVIIKNSLHVIEINARFTSSLLGLQEAYGDSVTKKISDLYLTKVFDKKKIKLKEITTVYLN